jgi:hypothetical protein
VELKEYIQHPETVPLKVKEVNDFFCKKCHNEETNGIVFLSNKKFEKDSVIKIRIQVEKDFFKAYGKVSNVRKLENGTFEIFVDFSKKIDPFKIKMVQQICQIIDYSSRKNIKEEVAADKWIEDNAWVFNDGSYNKNKIKI